MSGNICIYCKKTDILASNAGEEVEHELAVLGDTDIIEFFEKQDQLGKHLILQIRSDNVTEHAATILFALKIHACSDAPHGSFTTELRSGCEEDQGNVTREDIMRGHVFGPNDMFGRGIFIELNYIMNVVVSVVTNRDITPPWKKS